MKIADKHEIERKFLLGTPPDDLQRYPCREIVQGYILTDGISEIRLRRMGAKHLMTMKMGKGLKRREMEFGLSRQLFERLWPLTEGKRLEKVRYEMEQIDRVWEVDVYQRELTGLLVVEVEFASEAEAESFLVPEWFDQEVTRDERYKNKNLALNGIPGDRADNE